MEVNASRLLFKFQSFFCCCCKRMAFFLLLVIFFQLFSYRACFLSSKKARVPSLNRKSFQNFSKSLGSTISACWVFLFVCLLACLFVLCMCQFWEPNSFFCIHFLSLKFLVRCEINFHNDISFAFLNSLLQFRSQCRSD